LSDKLVQKQGKYGLFMIDLIHIIPIIQIAKTILSQPGTWLKMKDFTWQKIPTWHYWVYAD